MIYGIGCDISQIKRIREVFDSEDKLRRCFTDKETDIIKDRPERIAGTFSAKEAVAKALGTGFRGFTLKDIEILRDEYGRPFMSMDSLREVLNKIGVNENLKVFISISHERDFAVATCTIELVSVVK